MGKLVTGRQRLALCIAFLSLSLIMGCESWDLPLIDDGLVAYYPLNGDILDMSGNDLNGKLINGATYGADRRGAAQLALQLDGINDYFEIPDDPKLSPDSVSISLWLKANLVVDNIGSTGSTRHIYNKDNFATKADQQYNAFISKSKDPNPSTVCCDILVDVDNDDTCAAATGDKLKNVMVYQHPTFALNQWYHFVSVFSGQTLKLYINGELKKTQREATPIDKCVGGNLRFGAYHSGDDNFFNGMMDEIRIYNRGLTQAEVTALYNKQ